MATNTNRNRNRQNRATATPDSTTPDTVTTPDSTTPGTDLAVPDTATVATPDSTTTPDKATDDSATDDGVSMYVAPKLSRDDAEKLTESLLAWLSPENSAPIIKAWSGRIWEVYGLKDWRDYCVTKLGVDMLRPSVKARRALVKLMAKSGMTQRAIAVAMGVNQSQIARDLASADSSRQGTKRAKAPKVEPTRLEMTQTTGAALLEMFPVESDGKTAEYSDEEIRTLELIAKGINRRIREIRAAAAITAGPATDAKK